MILRNHRATIEAQDTPERVALIVRPGCHGWRAPPPRRPTPSPCLPDGGLRREDPASRRNRILGRAPTARRVTIEEGPEPAIAHAHGRLHPRRRRRTGAPVSLLASGGIQKTSEGVRTSKGSQGLLSYLPGSRSYLAERR